MGFSARQRLRTRALAHEIAELLDLGRIGRIDELLVIGPDPGIDDTDDHPGAGYVRGRVAIRQVDPEIAARALHETVNRAVELDPKDPGRLRQRPRLGRGHGGGEARDQPVLVPHREGADRAPGGGGATGPVEGDNHVDALLGPQVREPRFEAVRKAVVIFVEARRPRRWPRCREGVQRCRVAAHGRVHLRLVGRACAGRRRRPKSRGEECGHAQEHRRRNGESKGAPENQGVGFEHYSLSPYS